MICPMCKNDKPVEDFPKKPSGPYTWMCRWCERNRAAIRKHGITNQQKQQIARHQCGCAICHHPLPGGRGWTVDHDHDCCPGEKSCPKCRRGILCAHCNTLLGSAFERIEILKSAIEYLRRADASGICDWHRPVACAKRICGNEPVEHHPLTDAPERTNSESTQLENESPVTYRVQGGSKK